MDGLRYASQFEDSMEVFFVSKHKKEGKADLNLRSFLNFIFTDNLNHRFSVQKMAPVLLFCRQVLVNNEVPMHFL